MLRIILVIIAIISGSSACLITNCPRGGKRGENPLLSIQNIARECPSCGPGHQGQCFGPNICCGTTIGCFIGTPETYKCRTESLYSRPCIAGFSMCHDNTARCASNGICCSQEKCSMDSSCRINDEFNERKIAQEYLRLAPENEQ